MHSPTTVMDLNGDYYLDILGQQPILNIYTQICLCFPVADASSHSAIINTLTKGLERLSASFPCVAGQVVNEGSGEGNTGVFKIKLLEKFPRLVVKDCRDDPSMPTMDDLRRANSPFSMLDESVIAPRMTLPGSSGEVHQAMDMTGQGQIIDLLSKACRGGQFTSEELSSGNLARHNLIPLLDHSYQPGSELDHQIIKPTPSHSIPGDTIDGSTTPSHPPPRCTWTYFTFNPASLTALKSHATKSLPLSSGYVSTDDALSAFIWQSIMRARLPRLDSTAEATFTRAVDVRRYLDIPATYPGMVQNLRYHTYTVQKLVEEPLGRVASQLRSAVDHKTSHLAYDTRALATLLDRTPDKTGISLTATLDLSTDVMLSSWAKLDCYELDFNLGLGKPESVRRPQFVPVESLLYLMPKALDGEIAVALCLRDEDMERLRSDEEFAKYGRYVG
ncbi:hypothetical protein BD410DRAFT_789156 [Rickenella mellea]|uniref:Trichothecene 3-O-acetyltransferase-like N-terminal domain-containing protein n=1 Tax=Rickenella mellea TaxID=50990 RepID=A0A4Y7Q347_9AGAM|nr:hypothetical protein BD410DRAFT_789156 [Rickenella mellea]